MNRFAIVTPTYDEVDNIPKLIASIEKACKGLGDIQFTLFVVDDNSPDGTAEAARKAASKVKANNFRVKVLVRAGKEGIGKAYIYAFREVLKGNFDYLLQIDADFSHDPKYIKDFVEQARLGRDFVSASRYMKGGGIADWGLHRRMLSLGGNVYTRVLLTNKVTDYTNGFNMFSTKLLRQIKIDDLSSTGYGFFIELKFKAYKHAKNFGQIPIIMADRKLGKSKIPKNTILINLLLVPRLRLKELK
jgi:dolichol-phosphate mannosyltransferase